MDKLILRMYKLGALPPRYDPRTIKLRSILLQGVIPPTPDVFNVDASLNLHIDNPMYGNDAWGDCVIAARAHMTRRFEGFEQKTIIPIQTAEVLTEYWKEQGVPIPKCWARVFHNMPDGGLNGLDSLKAWRKGWQVGKKIYSIYAFAAINSKSHEEIFASLAYLRGDYVSIALPITAQKQDVWDVVTGPGSEPGSWGYHMVYRLAYDKNLERITLVTWGGLKQMTLAFNDKYVVEDYAVVDNRDSFLTNSPVDVTALSDILTQITS